MEALLLLIDLLLMILFLFAICRAEAGATPEDLSGFFAYKSEPPAAEPTRKSEGS